MSWLDVPAGIALIVLGFVVGAIVHRRNVIRDRRWTNRNGDKDVQEIKAVSITQKRPTKPRSGVVVTKLTVRIPDAAFLPLRPEAVIVVPEDMVAVSPIEVEAGDPS